MGAQPKSNRIKDTMLAGFEAEGMLPTRQARSRELVARLFNEGLQLLDKVDFDGLSIESLCERAGVTIGAFYGRFENKEAFVNALQRIVVAEARRNVIADYDSPVAPRDNLAHLLGWIAKGSQVWYARHEGLIRASLRRANGEREMWTPMRELGGLQISLALPRILGFLPPDAAAGAEQRVRLAFQMLFGTLNNMVLINPGPFTIHDPEVARMLAMALTQFIEQAPATRPDPA